MTVEGRKGSPHDARTRRMTQCGGDKTGGECRWWKVYGYILQRQIRAGVMSHNVMTNEECQGCQERQAKSCL